MPNITITPISSLNGLLGGNQVFASGTTGTNFNISSIGSTHTFNIPDASLTSRGLVTTGTQTFGGQKTVESASATHVPLVLKGASSQSGDWLDFTTSSNVIIGQFYRYNTNPGLGLILYATTDQTRGLQITPGNSNERPTIQGLNGFGVETQLVCIGEIRTRLSMVSHGLIQAGRDSVWFILNHGALASDTFARPTEIYGGDAYSSATSTNQNGGRLYLTAGNAATDAGKTGTGGHVFICGGRGSPSGVAGDVFLGHTLLAPQGKVKVSLGASPSGVGIVGGRFYSNVSAVGNVGTGEDDLITATPIPASGLYITGQSFVMRAWGTTANNGDAKTVKLYAGASVILTTSLTVGSANQWEAEAEVFRTGTSTQKYRSRLIESTLDTIDVENGTLNLNESGTITCKVTGEGTSDNDIVCEGLTIDFHNY